MIQSGRVSTSKDPQAGAEKLNSKAKRMRPTIKPAIIAQKTPCKRNGIKVYTKFFTSSGLTDSEFHRNFKCPVISFEFYSVKISVIFKHRLLKFKVQFRAGIIWSRNSGLKFVVCRVCLTFC